MKYIGTFTIIELSTQRFPSSIGGIRSKVTRNNFDNVVCINQGQRHVAPMIGHKKLNRSDSVSTAIGISQRCSNNGDETTSREEKVIAQNSDCKIDTSGSSFIDTLAK